MNKNKILTSLIFLVLSIFLLKIIFLSPTYSDETTYLNMAKNMAEKGLIPYKDFFYAHPPLHIYTITIFLLIFGKSFFAGKLVPLVFSFLCLPLVYLISKKFRKREKNLELLGPLFLLISPQFFSFSSISYGMWPAIFFGLCSLLLILEKKPHFSGILLTISIFYRYLLFLYVPLALYFSLKNDTWKKFLTSFVTSFLLLFCSFLLVFGTEFLDNTIIYHFFSKLGESSRPVIVEYLTLNSGFILISLFLFQAEKKEKELIIIPLSIDIFILLLFRISFYHYFLLSLPFYAITIGKLFSHKGYSLPTIILILFMVFANWNTIVYHNTPNRVFSDLERLLPPSNSTIFGDPILCNYLSFKQDYRVLNNIFDGDRNRIAFEPGLLERIKSGGPDYFIESTYYSSSFFGNLINDYSFIDRILGRPNVTVYYKTQ